MVNDNYLLIGRIVSTHGLDGRLLVKPMTDNADRFTAGSNIYLGVGGRMREFAILESQHYKKFFLMKFTGITSPELAEGFVDVEIFITREEAELTRDQLEQDDFYYYDLIDCDVILNNQHFGKVVDIEDGGAGNLLVIIRDDGKEFLIPFLKEMTDVSQLKDKKLIINPIPGLLEIQDN